MTRLTTRFELKRLNITELRGAYRKTFNELVRSEKDTPQRRNALASLETISVEMALRLKP